MHEHNRWPCKALTWVFPASAPLNEADDEQNKDQESYGTHQPDEPALCRDVHVVLGISLEENSKKRGKKKAVRDRPEPQRERDER